MDFFHPLLAQLAERIGIAKWCEVEAIEDIAVTAEDSSLVAGELCTVVSRLKL